MTREEKLRILDEALNKAYKEIADTESACMGTEDFKNLLNAIDQMQFMKDVRLREDRNQTDPEKDFAPKSEIPCGPGPEPEPEKPVENDENEKPKFKMEDVRGALAKARGRGVNVSEIIRSFGAENFQQITADQYPAIMAKLAEV